MKTSELTGAALDWAVAKCEGFDPETLNTKTGVVYSLRYGVYTPSTDWSQGGPIIEREGISVIQLESESIPDARGFWQGKYQAQWGAVIGERHSLEENHGSQGDYWGRSYHVDREAVIGPTPLIAAMRCYVASKLGDNIDIPKELT
jgi:hypothetical protein